MTNWDRREVSLSSCIVPSSIIESLDLNCARAQSTGLPRVRCLPTMLHSWLIDAGAYYCSIFALPFLATTRRHRHKIICETDLHDRFPQRRSREAFPLSNCFSHWFHSDPYPLQINIRRPNTNSGNDIVQCWYNGTGILYFHVLADWPYRSGMYTAFNGLRCMASLLSGFLGWQRLGPLAQSI